MATPNDPNRDALIRQQAERDAAASRASLIGTSLAGPRAEVNGPRARQLQQPSTAPRSVTTPATGTINPMGAGWTPTGRTNEQLAAEAAKQASTLSSFQGKDLSPDMAARANARDSRGITFATSASQTATPQMLDGNGVPTPAGRMARRSVVDEFNSTREGVMMPRAYDPTGARLRGRADAFNITNPRSRERELVDLAVRVANDSSLKGFTGARNAIIGQIMGQLDAGNAASLEAQQQAGRAGLGLQGFDQDSALQEFDRRGARLRDQFLEEGQMRLARENNDADLEQTDLAGQYQLDAAKLGGRGRGDGFSSIKSLYEEALGAEGATPESAAIRAAALAGSGGAPVELSLEGNIGRMAASDAISDLWNNDTWGFLNADALVDSRPLVETEDGALIQGNNLKALPLGNAGFWDTLLAPDTWGEERRVIRRGDDSQVVGADQLPAGVTFADLERVQRDERLVRDRMRRREAASPNDLYAR